MRRWREKDLVAYILGTWLGAKVFEYFFGVSASDVIEMWVVILVEVFTPSVVYFH